MPTALDEIVRVSPQLMNFRQSLRGKITALVIFCLTPPLVLCGLAAIYAVDRVHRYEAASALGVETALSVNAEEFAHRVQTERSLTAQARGSQSGFTNEVDAARKEVDEAAVELRAEIERPRDSLSAETASELFEAIAEIGSMRAGVSAGVLTAHEAYARYTSIVGAALAALEDAKRRAEALSPELGRALTVYLALASGTEFARQERALGAAALSPSVLRETKLADLSALVGAQQVAFQTIPRNATSAFALKWLALSTSDETRVVEQLRRTLLERPGASPSISAAEWFAACTARINALHALAGAMAEEIRISALREKSTAFWNAAIATMISIALILVVAALAVLVGRLVTRPLERLTNQLTTLSLDTCEMALPLERTDEIGALARAFS